MLKLIGLSKNMIVNKNLFVWNRDSFMWNRKMMSCVFKFQCILYLISANVCGIFGDNPISNFKFSSIEKNGHQNWIVYGKTGNFTKDQKRIDIKDMILEVFSENGTVESKLESPFATLCTESQLAFGNNSIEIYSNNYMVSGIDWQWDGKNKKMIIKNNAKVVFIGKQDDKNLKKL